MIGLNKIGLNQVQLNLVQLNQLYLNTLCAGQKRSGGDGFPRLPGDVTRWSFKGLTNEMMAKNPRLEDADHKGRFLTFKNFAWSGMSGCGGYTYNFREWLSLTKYASNVGGDIVTISSDKVKIINATVLNASHGVIKQTSVQKEEIFDFYVNITGLSNIDTSNNPLTFGKFDNPNQFELKDGINHVQYTKSASVGWVGFGFKKAVEHCDVTIELLPSYPGFIIGDGVDDYAVTEKNLDFEDTYTVYTAFIPFQEDPKRNMLLCGKAYTKDFYVQYKDLNNLMYYSARTRATVKFSNGFNLIACKRTPTQMVAKNLLTGETIVVDANSLVENPGLYYLWTTSSKMEYAKAAIAGQVICNGHFTTDEEDTKVLNWYKKEYPWLFFDQAWTVTGKTNEDTDRATIANITGNGNNLVLSNFGFAGNSGYGEYAQNFNGYGFGDLKTITYTRTAASMKLDVPAGSSENIYSNANGEAPIGFVYNFNLKITGLKTGNLLSISQGTTLDNIIADINQDGVYNIKATVDDSWNQRRIYFWIRNSNGPETTLSIEQIPDHQGYLVTDGVDDIIKSSLFTIGKHFTVVGDWKLLNNEIVNAGIIKSNSLFIYNTISGLRVFINRAGNSYYVNTKTLRAIVSDGRMYDDNWKEYLDTNKQLLDNSGGAILIGSSEAASLFTRLIFKNIAIYPRFISKEDCIKAYIYLQTLKAK